MKDVIVYLTLLRSYAKDFHYSAPRGESFYALHLLMDRVADPINDFIDQINEAHFMAQDLPVPLGRNIMQEVVEYIGNNYAPSIENVYSAIKMAQIAVLQAEASHDTFLAGKDVLSALSRHLAVSEALVGHCRQPQA